MGSLFPFSSCPRTLSCTINRSFSSWAFPPTQRIAAPYPLPAPHPLPASQPFPDSSHAWLIRTPRFEGRFPFSRSLWCQGVSTSWGTRGGTAAWPCLGTNPGLCGVNQGEEGAPSWLCSWVIPHDGVSIPNSPNQRSPAPSLHPASTTSASASPPVLSPCPTAGACWHCNGQATSPVPRSTSQVAQKRHPGSSLPQKQPVFEARITQRSSPC